MVLLLAGGDEQHVAAVDLGPVHRGPDRVRRLAGVRLRRLPTCQRGGLRRAPGSGELRPRPPDALPAGHQPAGHRAGVLRPPRQRHRALRDVEPDAVRRAEAQRLPDQAGRDRAQGPGHGGRRRLDRGPRPGRLRGDPDPGLRGPRRPASEQLTGRTDWSRTRVAAVRRGSCSLSRLAGRHPVRDTPGRPVQEPCPSARHAAAVAARCATRRDGGGRRPSGRLHSARHAGRPEGDPADSV
ncbi:hypothetical protein [Ornithinimicrobium kibberense]|uniref:hypothetical protein n=1 Tax=Ornithinimicrobium kibberense TaxID=282060 RepID=UPI00360C9F8D